MYRVGVTPTLSEVYMLPNFTQSSFIFIEREPTAFYGVSIPIYEDRKVVNKLEYVLKEKKRCFCLVSAKDTDTDIFASVSNHIHDLFPVERFLTGATDIYRYGAWNGYVLSIEDNERKGKQDIFNQLNPDDLTYMKLSFYSAKGCIPFIYELTISKCEVVENAKRPLYNYVKDQQWLRSLTRGGVDAVLFKTEDGKNVVYILNEKCIERIIRLDLIGYNRVI